MFRRKSRRSCGPPRARAPSPKTIFERDRVSLAGLKPLAAPPPRRRNTTASIDRMQQRRADEVRGVACTELAHRLSPMALEGARADLHPQRALLVRIALADQPQNLTLALGQSLARQARELGARHTRRLRRAAGLPLGILCHGRRGQAALVRTGKL